MGGGRGVLFFWRCVRVTCHVSPNDFSVSDTCQRSTFPSVARVTRVRAGRCHTEGNIGAADVYELMRDSDTTILVGSSTPPDKTQIQSVGSGKVSVE